MSVSDCGIRIHEGRAYFDSDPKMVLCFVNLKSMNPSNRSHHESDSFLVVDIDPEINFKKFAHLKTCPYKGLKATGKELYTIEYIFKQLTRGKNPTDEESNELMKKANEIWGLVDILSDFETSLLRSSQGYIDTRLKHFKKERNTHIERLYEIAKKMIDTHIKALEFLYAAKSSDYVKMAIQYHDHMTQFETTAKTKKTNSEKQSEKRFENQFEKQFEGQFEKEFEKRSEKRPKEQSTPLETTSEYMFNTPSMPNELEFQKKILVFVGFLGLGYWAVTLLRNIARNKLEPVLDRFLSNMKHSPKKLPLSKKSSSTKIAKSSSLKKSVHSLSEKSAQSKKSVQSKKRKYIMPKPSLSKSPRKYSKKITRKSKSAR